MARAAEDLKCEVSFEVHAPGCTAPVSSRVRTRATRATPPVEAALVDSQLSAYTTNETCKAATQGPLQKSRVFLRSLFVIRCLCIQTVPTECISEVLKTCTGAWPTKTPPRRGLVGDESPRLYRSCPGQQCYESARPRNPGEGCQNPVPSSWGFAAAQYSA